MLTVVKLASSGNGPLPGFDPKAARTTAARTIVGLIAPSFDAAPKYRLDLLDAPRSADAPLA